MKRLDGGFSGNLQRRKRSCMSRKTRRRKKGYYPLGHPKALGMEGDSLRDEVKGRELDRPNRLRWAKPVGTLAKIS